MNVPKPFNLWWLFAGAFIFCVALFGWSYAYGQHECQGGHNCNKDGGIVDVDLVGGDSTAVINGGRSYGVAGSDYDIGQCMYHAGGLTIAIGFRNKFCEGMDMIRSGMVDAGVLHICKQTKIGRNYDSLKDCKDGLVISYGEMTTNDTGMTENDKPVTESDDEDEDRYEALYARMEAYEERTVKAESEAKTARIQAQRASTAAKTVQTIQQAPDDAAERRAKARAALKGEE